VHTFINEQHLRGMTTVPSKTTTKFLSSEPTVVLIQRARGGDASAMEALLERCLPPLRRWARGRLPQAARGHLDTGDLVQDAAMNAIARLDSFEPRHVGAMQAYLRQSVINRIRDEMRRLGRRGSTAELSDDLASVAPSPLEQTIRKEAYDRYRVAIRKLKPKDRELVIARIEAQWTVQEITEYFGFSTGAAAGMAVHRALQRLSAALEGSADSD
jgi:RNA polymerase sigma factor (sigma-70 family)